MRKIRRLKREAKGKAKKRNHEIIKFITVVKNRKAIGYCKNCNAHVSVNSAPVKEEQEISGKALQLQCITEVDKAITEMLTENTGYHLLDSGGAYGRNHERNAGKTVEDFRNAPTVTFEFDYDGDKSSDIIYTISVFHYLRKQLALDDIALQFNKLQSENHNHEGFTHGVSKEASDWLFENFDVDAESPFNTYNGETNLSQILQGCHLNINGDRYIILQIHGGCDVRGGYTDARLFRLENDYGYLAPEDVYGYIEKPDKTLIDISNCYDGTRMLNEHDYSDVEIDREKDEIALWIMED